MNQDAPKTDTLYDVYGRDLYKQGVEDDPQTQMMANLNSDQSSDNSSQLEVSADLLGSGVDTSSSDQGVGYTAGGKTQFDNTQVGYILGIDKGVAKFYLGNATNYIQFDGTSTTIVGGLSVSSLNIPDSTTVSSMHVDTSGNTWWGTNVATGYATAPARILATGAATFTTITITGGSISGTPISSIPNNTSTDISLLGFSHNIAFTSASATQINWTSGTIVLSNGRTFSISSGNTGTMAAATYIYLDTAVSSTVLQTTTTYSTAMGANKMLLATAQNNTVSASVIPFGGGQPVLDGAANIGALSITAGSIAASTITAGKMSVSQLSAIAADLGAITAGSITINSGTASISSAGAAVFKSIQVGGSSVQYTLNDSGIFSFGDGSDGAGVADGSTAVAGMSLAGSTYTMTRDVYFTSLTVSTGVTIKPSGYRIFGTGVLTLNGTAVIQRNGNNGSSGVDNVSSAPGGAALADGYLKGSLAGAVGGSGANGPGANGVGTSNSIGSNGSTGGGGAGGGSGGTGGTATASNVKLIANWHLATMLDISASGSTVKFDNSASAGGGGNSILNGGVFAGGGGAGSGGGIVAIYFRSIVIGASATISANGGNGGPGSAGNAFGGGGGAGANGGQIILVYNVLSNSGSITFAGGTGGSKGASNAADGSAGSSGTLRQFQLSL